MVDALSSRSIPEIWEIMGKKRVLRTDLNVKQKTLLLAYTDIHGGILVEDLFEWTKYSKLSMFKIKVLQPLDDEILIEWDKENDAVFLSPLGVQEVETKILSRKV